ncbi:M23 family metallopeptidase [Lutibacter sp. Hel_I_33_5]|uniref:M23 family metallopeptidase n=1 Tax=Lutibacter sp. Hel_I_33_5 TaxID=1566289 RepID=UPI00119F8E05|nr:M23 family metallopeptidase [Lutibacter sp. Hel_I_33_5]
MTSLTISSQEKYPKDVFGSPLDIPIVLSGTFGELRNNHFHSGVDIKTQRRNGLKIYAPFEGYVSRIKISLWGYGKALYVTHPNGFTTVYAHLSKYGDGIEEYIKNVQYQKENYQTGNAYPKPHELPVKKGQIIAYSGDTGGYVPPHLHYEFRDTKTEHIINPMHFGLTPKDTKAPTINSVVAYPLQSDSRINQRNKKEILAIKNLGNNSYTTDRILASGTIGFGINVFDRLNDAPNKNGIYSLEMKVNGKRVYYHDVETFSFSESKYINLLIDYKHYSKYKRRYQKTHQVKGNTLSIYEDLINKGRIKINEGLSYSIEIIAKDYKNNTSSIKIPVKGIKSNTIFKEIDTTAFKIHHQKFNKFSIKNVTVAFPKNTFYNDLFLDFKVKDGVASIHNKTVPLDKKFTLTFNTSKYSKKEKKRLYIANVTNKKYPRHQYTRKRDSVFFTTTKTLGKYSLLSDNQKPKIYSINFTNEQNISKHNFLKVKIADVGSGIKSFRATIDNDWILMEYNLKKKELSYNFKDKKLVGNKHVFKIEVSDNVGNTNTASRTFYRKD